MFKQGDTVTYISKHKREKGIVKKIIDDKNTFIVYNCDGNWLNYLDYTAASTRNKDLISGWEFPVSG